jgi:4-hydroxymandelate oxidase
MSESRRRLLQLLAASPLLASGLSFARPEYATPATLKQALNIAQLKELAAQQLDLSAYHFIVGGSDDMLTTEENIAGLRRIKIRPRRLVDVSSIDSSVTLFGRRYRSPIILAPAGNQMRIHADAELATARAAVSRDHLMISSMMSNYSIAEIAEQSEPGWFQLYPSSNRQFMAYLMAAAERAGCETLVLTIDGPTRGNHEAERWFRMNRDKSLKTPATRLGNFEGYNGRKGIGDPAMTWEDLNWLRANTSMNIVLKGIVTAEDAKLCRKAGVDGVIVSNHGGRQEGNGRATIDVLPEVVDVLSGKMPVLVDGGIRRGADVLKALAAGADAVCVGRPYLFGLAAAGQAGVEKSLRILQAEFERSMQYAGTPKIDEIGDASIWRKG